MPSTDYRPDPARVTWTPTKPTHTFLLGPALLLLAAFALGLVQIQMFPRAVYLGDENFHYSAAVRTASCLRNLPANIAEISSSQDWITSLCLWPRPERPSAYYWFLAPVLIFSLPADEQAILHAARVTTLLLQMTLVAFGYGATRSLFPRSRHLPIATALLLGLLPSLTDLYGGLNTDAASIPAFALFAFALAHAHARRFRGRTWPGLLAAIGLGLLIKPSTWPSIPILAIWLFIFPPRRVWRSILLAAGAMGLAAGLIVYFPRVDRVPSHWFVADMTEFLLVPRRRPGEAKSGRYSLASEHDPYSRLEPIQFLAESDVRKLRGKTVTVGAWVLAPKGAAARGPVLAYGDEMGGQPFTGSGEWQFLGLQATIPPDAPYIAVRLPSNDKGQPVFFDGVVLAEGAYDISAPPEFADGTAAAGQWGGALFTNVLRNGSGEAFWPRLTVEALDKRDNLELNKRLWRLLAWRRTVPGYLTALRWLFVSFWATVNGTQPGLSARQMMFFAGLTGLALLGLVRRYLPGVPGRRNGERRTVTLVTAIAAAAWLLALLRAEVNPHTPSVLAFVGGRHALTSVVATAMVLGIGWLNLLPARHHHLAVAVIAIVLFMTDVWVTLNAAFPFYHCTTRPLTECLITLR